MSSRSKRRESLGSARSRRTPARPAQGGGPSIPIVPLLVLVGALAVAGLVAYLIWQQGFAAGDRAGVKEEADASVDLPGEWIDLATIYDGPYPDNAPHVTRNLDFIADGNNPPAGGPMWGNGPCPEDPAEAPPFCGPAPLGIYRTPWAPETLNHNLEHGGIVVWYNTTDQAIIDELEDLIEDRLRDGDFLVLTPYFDMEDETIALTAWSRIDKFPVSEYAKERVNEFLDAHGCRVDLEGFC
ncbi:MAG: DUF3105 domain-containing protein [Chloroflexi bacterium]|nr:DUF3105 domain-containing protein [Chloroflexota bacterium]